MASLSTSSYRADYYPFEGSALRKCPVDIFSTEPVGAVLAKSYHRYRLSRALRIVSPNALTKTSLGYTDKVAGSAYRTGRGALKDFATQQPILSPLNYHKLNNVGRWATGIGLSGAAGYYHYRRLYK